MPERQKKKLLIIKPVLPYPPDQGTKVVTFGLLQSLHEEYDITVLAKLCDRREEPHVRELERWCERVVAILAPNRKSVFHRLFYKIAYNVKSFITRRSLRSLYDCPGVFERAAARLAAEPFDLVIVEYWQLHRLLRYFPPERAVLFTHDIDMLVNREISLLERNLFRKLAAVRRWMVERQQELYAYKNSRNILTLTERDSKAVKLVAAPGTMVDVMPFGVDTDYFTPPGIERNRGEILFLGAMAAPFNRDALNFLITKIYPHLDDIEGLSFTIVGGHLPKELEYFSLQSEVEIVGRVRDVRPYLYRADCMIVPLRFSGGLRIRILEAMAAELPVLCTSSAIAGMPFQPDTDYLLANEPGEFAEQLGRFMRDPEMGARLAEHARESLLANYSREAQKRQADALIERIVDSE